MRVCTLTQAAAGRPPRPGTCIPLGRQLACFFGSVAATARIVCVPATFEKKAAASDKARGDFSSKRKNGGPTTSSTGRRRQSTEGRREKK